MTLRDATSFIGGALLAGALAGAWFAYGYLKMRSGDDRPPIVVSEGSIKLRHTALWGPAGGQRKWKSKQGNGKNTKSFNVTLADVPADSCNATTINGKIAVITYIMEGGDELRFWISLDRDQVNRFEPVIESPVDLAVDTTDPEYIRSATTGQIARLDVVGGSAPAICSFGQDVKPVIKFEFAH